MADTETPNEREKLINKDIPPVETKITARLRLFLYFVALIQCMGALAFGYNTGKRALGLEFLRRLQLSHLQPLAL